MHRYLTALPFPAAKLASKLSSQIDKLGRVAVEYGVPPGWLGYRWVQKASVREYADQSTAAGEKTVDCETIHSTDTFFNPLPGNIPHRDMLPCDRGWWGYSFWDVPEKRSDPTFIATFPDCTIISYFDSSDDDIFKDDFWVGILNRDDRPLDLREFHFGDQHAKILRKAKRVQKYQRATWLIERVYHNYSHWLTAHLPKFLLMKERDQLAHVLFPAERPQFIDDSLRLVGIDPDTFRTFQAGIPIEVQELTLVGNDRFRPELLQSVRRAYSGLSSREPHRRVYISREQATRRRLVNEQEVWPILEKAGFEKVFMEDLAFEEQVRLMQETSILFAPHGAGLTNMLFCPAGTHVVEIANLDFPNPNFYAVAAAMEHHYWVLSAEPLGDGHPLQKDLKVDPIEVEELMLNIM